MDTVTQIALGAAVGEAVMGRQIGRWALLWGAVCGLLPDLDVLIPFDDAVKSFTYHRGASHSLFVLALLTPIVAWAAMAIHKQSRPFKVRWHVMIYAAFATHVLLDCFTVYGTQIFWPLATPPVMWSTVFIIDPVYTLPLAVGVAAALATGRKTARGHRINAICLVLSCLYLGWSVGAKWHVSTVVRENLARQQIGHRSFLTTPTPFNTLVWRILVMDQTGYYEGYYALPGDQTTIRFNRYDSNPSLIETLDDHWPVKRLQWFTQGFYSVKKQGNDIVMADLRMGLEPAYVFRFKVAHSANPHPRPVKAQRVRDARSFDQLKEVWLFIKGHISPA